MSWLRIGSIAVTALLLASCRSMPTQDQQAAVVAGSGQTGPIEFRPIEPGRIDTASAKPAESRSQESDAGIQQVAFTTACEPAGPCEGAASLLIPAVSSRRGEHEGCARGVVRAIHPNNVSGSPIRQTASAEASGHEGWDSGRWARYAPV